MPSKPTTTVKKQTYKRSYSSNLDIASRQSSALIIEFGAAFIRVGIAGEPTPRHVLNLQEISQNLIRATNVDTEYEYWASLPSLPSLIRSSSTESTYEDLLPWFSNLYTHHLLLKPRSRRTILILPIQTSQTFRKSLESVLLDHLQVPSVLFVDSFRTIPYAIGGCGKSTGMMVDLGCVEGRLVCFFDGGICEDTLEIVPIGYRSLLERIAERNRLGEGEDAHHNVKDADVVHEMYFDLKNPNSLIYALCSSLMKCPIDLRKEVAQRIIFVGGGVEGISQFEQRFLKCVKGLFELDDKSSATSANGHKMYCVKDEKHSRFSSLANVIMKAPLGVLHPLQFRPSCVSWAGGSIMGSIKLSEEKWINRK